MDSEALRSSVLNDVVDILISCVEKGAMTEEDFPPIATYALEKIEKVNSDEEAATFLKELAEKWPVFSSLATLQEGHNQEKVEGEVAEGVLQLAQSGKIDEALSLAKSTTQN